MKHLDNNRLAVWRLIASALLLIPAATALSQGRPGIIWASGSHSGSVNSVAYSSDGQFLISASNDRTIKLWRSDGAFIKSLSIPYDINAQLTDVRSVAFSPDGALIAAGVEQYNATAQASFGAVQIWRVSDGVLVQNFTGFGAAVNSIAFSPDGQFLASGSDQSVKVWRLANGTLVSTRFDHTQTVNAVAFSRDGLWLASASDDGTAKLYQTSGWGVVRTFSGHTDSVRSLAFSADNARLATGSLDQTARIWNVSNGMPVLSLAHGSPVYAVAFASNGQILASSAWDHTIKLWSPGRGSLIHTLTGSSSVGLTLAFSPDSQTLASGSWYPEYAIKFWNPLSGTLLQTVTNHSEAINDLIFMANGRLISGGDFTARFWDGSNGGFLGAINASQSVTAMALSPDGQLIAVPGSSHTVQIYRTSDRTLVQTLVGHTDDVTGLAFSHDGTRLASGAFFNGSNDRIKLWRVSDWTVVRELSGPFIFGPFTAINFSPDDAMLSASCEGTPAVWRVSDGMFLRTFPGIGQTRFSPNGALLAVGSEPVRVFRTSDWMQVATLSDQNQALAFSPDGAYLALAGQSQIQFWRVSDWLLRRFYDQELGYAGSGVSSLAFSCDGSRFAYGRLDAVVAVAKNPVNPKGSR